MFDYDDYRNFECRMYKDVQTSLKEALTLVSTRRYGRYIEELYRLDDSRYYLEVFYQVPSPHSMEQARKEPDGMDKLLIAETTNPSFGFFDDYTSEPMPLTTVMHLFPKEVKQVICYNMDQFSEMTDIFESI